jgi:hypothetical protein
MLSVKDRNDHERETRTMPTSTRYERLVNLMTSGTTVTIQYFTGRIIKVYSLGWSIDVTLELMDGSQRLVCVGVS